MFCTKCGNQIKDGFKFCPKCGTPIHIEKEKVESEAKAQEEEVGDKSSEPESEKTKDAKINDTLNTSSKKASESQSSKQFIIPNPFISKELDIEGVKNRAEQGDRNAMFIQSFRYEMGIGTEMDMKKYNELKELGAVRFAYEWISLYYYSRELANPYIVMKNR